MNYLITTLLLLLIFSCGNSQQKFKAKKSNTPTILIKGKITYTESWCGGARPTEEMEREFATPKPYAYYHLYLRKDTNNIKLPIYMHIVTDSLGYFSIKLPAGKYTVVDDRKKDEATYKSTLEKYKKETSYTGAIDKACYTNYVSEPDFIINVERKSTSIIQVEYNYHKGCNWSGAPCVEYRGPYPP